VDYNTNNMKKCGYKNCDIDISNKRINSIYCCRKHKQLQYRYEKRQIDKIKREATNLIYR